MSLAPGIEQGLWAKNKMLEKIKIKNCAEGRREREREIELPREDERGWEVSGAGAGVQQGGTEAR